MANQSLMDDILHEGERLDDLDRDGLRIIQNPSWFCFGMDAVLISAYAKVPKEGVCLDLCTGNGVIPILMSARYKEGKSFYGLELQHDVVDMALRSVRYNSLLDKVFISEGDIRDAVDIYGAARFDVITCNPPYLKENGGLINPTDHKALARHEIMCTLKDVIQISTKLLVSGGHFYMVHRPFRLAEILSFMVEYHLEPKRMRLVYPRVDDEPNMVLIEGVRGGSSGMIVDKPLIIYDGDNYTEEVRNLYTA